jgi:hypothetical protein
MQNSSPRYSLNMIANVIRSKVSYVDVIILDCDATWTVYMSKKHCLYLQGCFSETLLSIYKSEWRHNTEH